MERRQIRQNAQLLDNGLFVQAGVRLYIVPIDWRSVGDGFGELQHLGPGDVPLMKDLVAALAFTILGPPGRAALAAVDALAPVIELLDELHEEGLSLVLVTHDLPVIAQVCERAAVMYAGEIVESACIQPGSTSTG